MRPMQFLIKLVHPLFIAVLASCGTGLVDNGVLDLEHDFQIATVEGVYSMKVPSYMSESTELSEDASLQYENLIQDCYLIVIDENTNEFIDIFEELEMLDNTKSALENYTLYQKESISNTMVVTSTSYLRELKINGNKALMVQIDGGVPEVDTDVTYLLTVIQGKTNMYTLLYWTTKENSENALLHFEQSIRTFQDL